MITSHWGVAHVEDKGTSLLPTVVTRNTSMTTLNFMVAGHVKKKNHPLCSTDLLGAECCQ